MIWGPCCSIHGNESATGLQFTLLKIMFSHPTMAAKMPTFEDKRRLKLPTFSGLDVFQSHVKNVANYVKDHMGDLDVLALALNHNTPFRPPRVIPVAPTLDSSNDSKDGRNWLNPMVKEFGCSRRLISHDLISTDSLPLLSEYFSPREISLLVSVPLHSIDLKRFVEQRSHSDENHQLANSELPINVLSHPASQSFIARVSVTRLEKDFSDFIIDERQAMIPMLRAVNENTQLDAQGIVQAGPQIATLIKELEALRDRDLNCIIAGIRDVLDYCNGNSSCQSGNAAALCHRLRQLGGKESTLVWEIRCH